PALVNDRANRYWPAPSNAPPVQGSLSTQTVADPTGVPAAELTDNVYSTAWPSKDGPTLATKLAVVAATTTACVNEALLGAKPAAAKSDPPTETETLCVPALVNDRANRYRPAPSNGPPVPGPLSTQTLADLAGVPADAETGHGCRPSVSQTGR